LIKQSKPHKRPKTAKNGTDPEFKSPKSVRHTSRKAKNVFKGPKGMRKSTKSKKRRKSSLSPSHELEGIDRLVKNTKKIWGYKRSVNDVPKVLTNQYFRQELDASLTVIQKYIRGYFVYQKVQNHLEEERKRYPLPKENVSSISRNTLERISSDNTLARATNQAELLKIMVPKAEETKIQTKIIDDDGSIHDSPELPKRVPNVKFRRHTVDKNINSKSITSFDKTANDKNNMKDMISNSLKLL
jgi:hypothetical protein